MAFQSKRRKIKCRSSTGHQNKAPSAGSLQKKSMRVTVMTDVPSSHSFRRSNAALQRLTANMLELDGGMVDLELPVESIFEVGENADALRRRNIGNRHVACEGARVRAQAPNMQVVNIYHALNRFHDRTNLVQRDAARRALEQD